MDPKLSHYISSSAYDTKIVHCLSMVSEYLKWVVKDKDCFNVDMGKF